MLRKLLAVAAFVFAVLSPSAHAQNCAPFTDVLASSAFCDDIQWIYNRGITLGCAPNQFCPSQFVRRDQMAAFLYRLGFENAFLHGGNAFGEPAALGTTDNQALDVRVNNARVMRYEPNAISPNVIGGSPANIVTTDVRGATIAGGGLPVGDTDPDYDLEAPNSVTDVYGTVGGGYANTAGNAAGTTTDSSFATVSGGFRNWASGFGSTVTGGYNNTASGFYSTVPGGSGNLATGNDSFAAGHVSIADQHGCFVFANWSSGQSGSCLGTQYVARFLLNHGLSVDYFSRRADGGGTRWVYIGDLFAGQTIATWTGGFLSDAGVWVNASSSREAKTDFAPVDSQSILDKVAALPITTWRYREGEDGVRHIGPMAEDFNAAFAVGYGPHTIADLDARGVALAAIQGLHQLVRDKEARIVVLERALDELKRSVDALLARR